MKISKWHKRMLNQIIDIFAIEILSIPIFPIIENNGGNLYTKIEFGNVELYTVSLVVFLAVFIFYYYISELFFHKSLGKLITGSAIKINSNRKKWLVILIRTFSRLIFIEFIWFIRANPRGLHDRLSDTLVVDSNEPG